MARETMLVIKRLLPRIPHPFASAKHFHAKDAGGEASNKYANLQSEYAGNLAKIKTLKRRMDAWDMISPFVIFLNLLIPMLSQLRIAGATGN